jgi:hypothetical protein
MKSAIALSARERLHQAAHAECLTIAQCALVVNCSPQTIRRRLPLLAPYIIRHGRIVRIRRQGLLKLFGFQKD